MRRYGRTKKGMKSGISFCDILQAKHRKGVSPTITTILLISMVVIIGLIIFLWFRGMIIETTIKFGKNIELVCEDVEFDASYSGGILYISNNGNVPIYSFKIKLSEDRSYKTKDLTSSEWPTDGLKAGDTFTGAIDTGGANKITLIPVLRGSAKTGEKNFVCDEKRFGHEISL